MALTAFSIWRGFCMSGRKLLDSTTYIPFWLDEICYFKLRMKTCSVCRQIKVCFLGVPYVRDAL